MVLLNLREKASQQSITMKIHYLEIVTPDVEAVCKAYEHSQNASFSQPDEMLGGAKTSLLQDGSILGVRGPLRENETPVVRPYYLVDDIEAAVQHVEAQGAEIAMTPMEISEKGKFAIYIIGGIEQGFWEL
ncbi:Putative hydroxylase [Pseudoalteromonas phenolica]|uniref:Putative hydroxylase n=2 Tax=Pseudoalteromonas phenolica TaxID=161398 RepID=A0A0S2K2M3_9GAMM|nr:Putative hydroxylase [Pseudoalteromonas phenolica]